jgi:hypothetical protein
MTQTTGRVTAAPAVLKFKTPEGKILELQFSPLSDMDSDEIDEWLQARLIENTRRSVEHLSQAVREEMIQLAMKTSLEVTFLSLRGVKMLATLPGMVRVCWQSIRKRHPEVTEAELRSYLLHPENMDALNTVFEKVNDVPKRKPSKNRARAR